MAESTRFRDMQNQISALREELTSSLHQLPLDLAQFQTDIRSHLQEQQTLFQQQFADYREDISALIMQLQCQNFPPPPPPPPPSLQPIKHGHTGILGPPPVHSQPRLHSVKLDFPRFSSGDPTDWVFTVEQYFRYHMVPADEQLLLASIHLDRPASRWFQGLSPAGLVVDWPSFVRALFQRFGPSTYDDPAGSLTKLYQKGAVLEFQDSFEELSSKVSGLSSDFLKSTFISGLKSHIRRPVLTQRPVDLHDAFALARVYEDQFLEHQSFLRTPNFKPPPIPSPSFLQSRHPTSTNSISTSTNNSTPRLPIKRLTLEEMQSRRACGLCFNCDEQFVKGHRCKGRPA